jgi:hypothetical protein
MKPDYIDRSRGDIYVTWSIRDTGKSLDCSGFAVYPDFGAYKVSLLL